jgi:hypothetical protein
MNFVSAATEHSAFARELPRLSPKCDVCFRPTERDAEYRETDEDEFHYESPAWAAERRLKSTLSVRAHYQAGQLHLLSKARRSFHFRFRSAPQYASAQRLGHIARVARSYGLAVAWDSASMFLFKSLPLL